MRTTALPIDVRNAAGGAEALAILRTSPLPADMILLDIKMPAMSGFEVLEGSQARRDENVPVVMYSSSDQERDVKRARELGAHAYYVKPGRLEQLVEFVRRLYHSWIQAKPPCDWPAAKTSRPGLSGISPPCMGFASGRRRKKCGGFLRRINHCPTIEGLSPALKPQRTFV